MPYYYVVNEVTREITGPIELPVTPGIGIQVPGNAIELTELLPLAESGYVWVWRSGTASQLIDLRNTLAYYKTDGMATYWSELGPLPDYLTSLPRPSQYHVWKNDNWALDEEAQRLGLAANADIERDNRLCEAVIRVAPLQYAYELGEAGSDQLTALQAWKRYAIRLSRIELQADYPLNIDWPAKPGKGAVLPSV
ncbi:tail fiber assembly protein [Pseudomonas sp. P2757]|uniref:tail fiber assembly protein n=1 Tax=unclassified Pseudomonas TaxID=196821 RepID=UPI003B5B2BC7